jgi:hypothetical protein
MARLPYLHLNLYAQSMAHLMLQNLHHPDQLYRYLRTVVGPVIKAMMHGVKEQVDLHRLKSVQVYRFFNDQNISLHILE